VLVEDFRRGQGDDDFVAALEERFDLLQRRRPACTRQLGRLGLLWRQISLPCAAGLGQRLVAVNPCSFVVEIFPDLT